MKNNIKTITVEDAGCDPVIPQGAKALCVTGAAPAAGDYVIVSRRGAPSFVRVFSKRDDGSILLRALNRNADSYSTTMEGLETAGFMILLKIEYSFPASARTGFANENLTDGHAVAQKRPEPEGKETEGRTDETELMTFEEAMSLLKVRRTTMYSLLRSGELKASKVGKLWRITRSAVSEYIEKRSYHGNNAS